MNFEWNEAKNKVNREKHGIWFEEARSVFADDLARVFYDPEHSEDEERFIVIGMSSSSRLLMVVHCYREEGVIVRIISARKSTKKERLEYEERI